MEPDQSNLSIFSAEEYQSHTQTIRRTITLGNLSRHSNHHYFSYFSHIKHLSLNMMITLHLYQKFDYDNRQTFQKTETFDSDLWPSWQKNLIYWQKSFYPEKQYKPSQLIRSGSTSRQCIHQRNASLRTFNKTCTRPDALTTHRIRWETICKIREIVQVPCERNMKSMISRENRGSQTFFIPFFSVQAHFTVNHTRQHLRKSYNDTHHLKKLVIMPP